MSGTFTVINPATAAAIREVSRATVSEVDAAIARAVVAQRSWASLAPVARADALRAFARVVESHIEELALLEVLNSGHPINSARWEASHVAQVLNYYAGAPERLSGQQIPVAGGIDITFHEPYGVVGIIVPWNFPMTIAAWGFAPALAAGNAVVLKPAELTPLTAMRLGELALEAGLPEGLFEVVTGSGSVVGQRFVSNHDVRKVVFTGSTEVGTDVAAGCARALKPVTLELGGKSANVIFEDADLERAAASAPGAVFDNAGQDCCARSRILVQRSVFDRFLELLEPAVADWRVGDPHDEATEMGPLISEAHRDSVIPFVKHSRVAFRGSAPGWAGFLVRTGGRAARLSAGPCRPARDLRAGRRGAAVRRRGRRHPPRQRHDLRSGRIDLDREPRSGRAGLARSQERRPVGQLALLRPVRHAVRRNEGVRARSRARARRRRALHRDEERVLRDGCVVSSIRTPIHAMTHREHHL